MSARKQQLRSKGERPHSNETQLVHDRPQSNFPLAHYVSTTGIHTSLLAFTTLFLPRTPLSVFASLSSWSDQRGQGDALQVLTEHPERTLNWICVGVFVLQLWWAAWIRNWSLEARMVTTDKRDERDNTVESEQKLQRREWNKHKVTAFRDACLCTMLTSVIFHIGLVVFGAPLFSHHHRTYLLGLLLALLAVFTPAFTLGTPSLKSGSDSLIRRLTWVRLYAEFSPRTPIERAMVYPAIGTFFGCWSGVVPIGLDWDRPWQAWPLTCAYGAIFGYIVGSLLALVTSVIVNFAELDLSSGRASRLQSDSHTAKKKS